MIHGRFHICFSKDRILVVITSDSFGSNYFYSNIANTVNIGTKIKTGKYTEIKKIISKQIVTYWSK